MTAIAILLGVLLLVGCWRWRHKPKREIVITRDPYWYERAEDLGNVADKMWR